eukprot:SAG22_NODE_302_length_12743_cov_12.397738_1_plen_137_part_00
MFDRARYRYGEGSTNPLRFHDAGQAVELDALVEAVWEGHPARLRIAATDEIWDKHRAMMAAFLGHVPKPLLAAAEARAKLAAEGRRGRATKGAEAPRPSRLDIDIEAAVAELDTKRHLVPGATAAMSIVDVAARVY